MNLVSPVNRSRQQSVDLSVVVPVFGGAQTLLPLHARLTTVLSKLVERYEIVFVDDRDNDGAWVLLQGIAAEDPCVVACRMSRNVGQQLAITAGLEQCSGDYAVVMDCDLQDPPEVIPALLKAAGGGADIVFARRKSDHQPFGRMFANLIYFKLLGLVSNQRFDGELGAFSLISRRVINAFLMFSERDRHYLMILREIGFENVTIDYVRSTRSIGASSYTFPKLLALAVSGIVFTTTRVLHWVIYAGLTMSGVGLLWAILATLQWMVRGAAPGWTSLIVAQLVIGGVVTLCIGVTGLYVGKIFENVQQRPLYFIQERIDVASRSESKTANIAID